MELSLDYYLKDKFENIQTKKDFVNYLNVLKVDFKENNREWENITINDYLDSVNAWLASTLENDNFPEFNKDVWPHLALLFYVGKIYE